MRNLNVDILRDLLEIAIDSKSFYLAAIDAVEDTALKDAFRGMADAKDELIDTLATQLTSRTSGLDGSDTAVGNLRMLYSRALAALGTRDAASYTYTEQLESLEERLLGHFTDALATTDSLAIRATLLDQLPKMRACHGEMKRLKLSLAA